MSVDLELTIERPVAGGDMIARHDGRIVFVSGAIPGERVIAAVTRRKGDVTWADARTILEASPDRVDAGSDPRCGGRTYAHVRYERQLALKAEVIADAFRRLARRPLDEPVPVLSSPGQRYRMRARLHVQRGRVGFLREGTHQVCAVGPTEQLSADAASAVDALVADRRAALDGVEQFLLSETAAGHQRVLVCELQAKASLDGWVGRGLVDGITGIVVNTSKGQFVAAGEDRLDDGSLLLPGARGDGRPDVRWRRKGASFFQGNRFLVGSLLDRVLALATGDRFVDLYAGVGLFATPMAARGQQGIAVEGDAGSAADLAENAHAFRDRLVVQAGAVEAVVGSAELPRADVVVADPPRTGLSAATLEGLLRWAPPRLVYVSCDVPTLARDAGRLFGSGYRLTSLEALDMFPHTPHVECVAVFDR